MSMKGMFWAMLVEDRATYDAWIETGRKPEGFNLQRCKPILTMLDVYQAQKGGVEILRHPGWEHRWNTGQILEIVRRLDL